jgi:hypothetical protein
MIAYSNAIEPNNTSGDFYSNIKLTTRLKIKLFSDCYVVPLCQ